MPALHRVRATVITPTLTYKAHELQIAEDDKVVAVMNLAGDALAILEQAEWSYNGQNYRVEGLDGNGERQVWQSRQVCLRCVAVQVLDTPEYDIPK